MDCNCYMLLMDLVHHTVTVTSLFAMFVFPPVKPCS